MAAAIAQKKRTILRLTHSGWPKAFDFSGDVLTIGRDEGCTITFDDPILSRLHCEIRREGDNFRIRDLNSYNGTFVNKAKIGDRGQHLSNWDEIKVGNVIMHAHIIVQGPVQPTASLRRDPKKVLKANLKFLKRNFDAVAVTMTGSELNYVDFNYDGSGLIVRLGNLHAELFSKESLDRRKDLLGGTFAVEGEPPLIDLEKSAFSNDEYSKKVIIRTIHDYNLQFKNEELIVNDNLKHFAEFEDIIDSIGRIGLIGDLSKLSRFRGDFVFNQHMGIIVNIELGTTSHVSDFAKKVLKLTVHRYNGGVEHIKPKRIQKSVSVSLPEFKVVVQAGSRSKGFSFKSETVFLISKSANLDLDSFKLSNAVDSRETKLLGFSFKEGIIFVQYFGRQKDLSCKLMVAGFFGKDKKITKKKMVINQTQKILLGDFRVSVFVSLPKQ